MSQSATATTPIHLINQSHALPPCLQELARQSTLSFDLEFDSNSYSYGVTLCVIQVATAHHCYVIDGLAGLDLRPLYALFEAAHIQKIVHAPGEDLRLLHSLGCYPKNVFDTEVVARLLNYEQTSLTVLLREKLGFEMNKKQQRSNWLQRPLSAAQVRYAADDVIWLAALKAVLEAEAAAKGLLPFVAEEQALLSTTIYTPAPPTDFLKPADRYLLSPWEQYITAGLLRYRDDLARSINRPAYQVMSEDLVRELAAGTRLPQSLADSTGVHPRFKNNRFAAQLEKELSRLHKAAADQNLSTQKPTRPRLTPSQQAALRQAASDRENVFAPIQQALVQRFGEHTARYLLSNKMVNEILRGAVGLRQLKPAYRQAVIREIAAAKGFNLHRYDNGTATEG